MKRYKHLSPVERQDLYKMKSQGLGIRAISRALGRSASTVSREVKRNGSCVKEVSEGMNCWERARYAQLCYRYRLKHKKRGKRKAVISSKYGQLIIKYLVDHRWSPEMISLRFPKISVGNKISMSTIYRMIKSEGRKLLKYLPHGGEPYRQRVMNRRGCFQQASAVKRSIHERSDMANMRQEVGHYEIDSIVGKRGTKGGILTIVDRCTRHKVYYHLINLEAETVKGVIRDFLNTRPKSEPKTITFDNGSEFAEWKQLEKMFPGLLIYFCDAYRPAQRGSVERANRDFRKFAPKGTDFSTFTQSKVNNITKTIAEFPLKIFNGLTAQEFYSSVVTTT
jgi:transposase, IS30 family